MRLLRPVVGSGTSDDDCENGRRCGGGGRVALALAGGTRREFAIQPDMKTIARSRSWLSLDMDASSCRLIAIAIVVVYRLIDYGLWLSRAARWEGG